MFVLKGIQNDKTCLSLGGLCVTTVKLFQSLRGTIMLVFCSVQFKCTHLYLYSLLLSDREYLLSKK